MSTMGKHKFKIYFLARVFTFCFLISYSQSVNSQNDIKGYGSCEDGYAQAVDDAKNKIYKSYSYGLIARTKEEWKFNEYYQNYMKSKYGIIVKDGGCVITAESECYRKKMNELIKKEFGSNIFKQTREEAKKLFNKKK